ncbi:MAG: hypothetical protein WC740_07715 [Verrucomicrobiia bacterium]
MNSMTTMNLKFALVLLASCLTIPFLAVAVEAAEAAAVPLVQPWRRVPLDADYGGAWVVAGDLDGDGAPEIVSARNVNRNDTHYTSAVAVQRLDGSVLWRWGDPKIGRRTLHHDVACQVYDWDGDGRPEVVLATEGFLVELEGATGRERRRLPLPKDATDCIVFANLSGGKHASDVLVKTRYSQIWAYNHGWKQLWTISMPGGYRTAHQPLPIDLDGDGRDEIMAGYSLLNPDGSVRWTFQSQKVEQGRGHLDCMRVLRRGQRPEDFRLALTLCGANCLAVCDGLGRPVWEIAGHHFESLNIGRICGDVAGPQIAVDIDHRPPGQSPLWVVDENGKRLWEVITPYSRFHGLVDWTGEGTEQVLIAGARSLFDSKGRCIASMAMSQGDSVDIGFVADMTGDGLPDIVLTTDNCPAVYIYENKRGRKPSRPVPSGTGVNFTFY